MLVVKNYSDFNFRRYSNPWIAKVNTENGKIDFAEKIGNYTGGYNKGEAGQLYINKPVEGTVYVYGQKDYRANNGGYEYVKYVDDALVKVSKQELINNL